MDRFDKVIAQRNGLTTGLHKPFYKVTVKFDVDTTRKIYRKIWFKEDKAPFTKGFDIPSEEIQEDKLYLDYYFYYDDPEETQEERELIALRALRNIYVEEIISNYYYGEQSKDSYSNKMDNPEAIKVTPKVIAHEYVYKPEYQYKPVV